MKRQNEISSTEKLLEVIRGKGDPKESPAPSPARHRGGKESGLKLARVLAFSRAASVGIVIGHFDLTLVALRKVSDRQWKLLNHTRIPIDPGIDRESRKYQLFLKGALARFCADFDQLEIWCCMSSARVEIRFLTIPKIPEAQIPNAVYWSFKKLAPFNEKEMIFDYTVLGETTENGVQRWQVVACTAPQAEVDALKTIFSRVGYPLTGLSIIPFSFQNLFRSDLLPHGEDNVCTLYIGQDWSRIDIFARGDLLLSRDIKTGLNSFIDALFSELTDSDEADPAATLADIRADGPTGPSDANADPDPQMEARRLFALFMEGRSDLIYQDRQIHEVEIADIVMPVLDRLVRQLERTLEHFTLHFGHNAVSRVYLTGELAGYSRLLGLLERQVSLPIGRMDPFTSPALSLKDREAPDEPYEKDAAAPALGLAISDNARTPNFLFTFRQKSTMARIRRINRNIFMVFIVLTGICSAVYGWQNHVLSGKRKQVAALAHRLEQFSPRLDKDFIQKMLQKTEQNKKIMKGYADNFLSMAVLNELSSLTPESIRLLNLKAHFSEAGDKKGPNGKKLEIEGVIRGNTSEREALLAVYMLKLNDSPLFQKPAVGKKTVRIFENQEVLRFVANVEMI